jgi:hypothetical protein
MRRQRITWLLILSLIAVGSAIAADTDQPRQGVPHITAVEPASGKAGATLTATGEYLDKSRVAELYLSTSNTDLRVPILEQSATAIKFKIPSGVQSGRFRLTVLMAGPDPKLLEQPVTLLVE